MASVGKRVPPSPKPKKCGDCKVRLAIKGKAYCAQCMYEAERRTTKAQTDHAEK